MKKFNRRSLMKASAAAAAGYAALPEAAVAQTAGLTPDDLKTTLTPLGGLRAGNAEGTIPAWTGEAIPLPAGYQTGTPRPDPFAGEKPLFSITAQNLATYQAKLPQGALELFRRYPEYRIDVYPTHRTAIAPQYVYDNTYKNAQNGQISSDGNSIYNVYGGVPFPLASNGKEAMWNHLLTFRGVTIFDPTYAYQITSDGELVAAARNLVYLQYPYYFEGRESEFKGIYNQLTSMALAPTFLAGQAVLALEPINILQTPVRAWAYLPGQRRTRLAPQLQYDTPIATTGGVINWDEVELFYGALDEYDCKLVGKTEMYIPYNNNRAWTLPIAQQITPHYFNPDAARWELHRVWVVEMTLAPGKRNVDSRRLMYLDEDTWGVCACDIFDASGALWKYGEGHAALLSDVPCVLTGFDVAFYDFHVGDYAFATPFSAEIPQQWQPIPEKPTEFFSAGQLAALAGGY